MPVIEFVKACEIIDSRGRPTIEVELTVHCDALYSKGVASAPSGLSVGRREALELRDGGARHCGYGVLRAVNNVQTKIASNIIGKEFNTQFDFDQLLLQLDGTSNKEKLGGNAMIATSFAFANACAAQRNVPLFQYLYEVYKYEAYKGGTLRSENGADQYIGSMEILEQCMYNVRSLLPMVNIVNGGKHASNKLDIQEFMIVPVTGQSIDDRIRIAAEVFHALRDYLMNKGLSISVGDEGGFAPDFCCAESALDAICGAISNAGYSLNDVKLALDVAASSFYEINNGKGEYRMGGEKRVFCSATLITYYQELLKSYPIISIEDPLDEDDIDGWMEITRILSKQTQLVGDDLFVTNAKNLVSGIERQIGNAVIIKPNQVGTLSEVMETVRLAHYNKYNVVVSHRSGETEDVSIVHLAVALGSKYIKVGSMSRTDRVCKYNELLRIYNYLCSCL